MPKIIESVYRFLGDIDISDPIGIRQLMILLHNHLSPDSEGMNPCLYDAYVMSQDQKRRVATILLEAEESELLKEMVLWFGAHGEKTTDREILTAVRVLQQHATWYVRKPNMYTAEYQQAKVKWARFLRIGRLEGCARARDEKKGVMSVKEMLNSPEPSARFSSSGISPRRPKAYLKHKEKKIDSDDESNHKKKRRGSNTSNESIESVNIFAETMIPGSKRTRGGLYTR